MTRNEWPDDIQARAEIAMLKLEAFWDRFDGCATEGRQRELPKLEMISLELVSVTEAHSYARQVLGRIGDLCRQLARARRPATFDEERALVQGLGDVSNLRGWMAEMGLLKDGVRWREPQ